MLIANNITELIGKTPLVRINRLAGDAQAMASIGREFAEEAQKIATKGMPNT